MDGRNKWLLSAKVARRVESAPLTDMPHSLIKYVKGVFIFKIIVTT